MKQCERILAYLDEHGSITRMEAMSKLHIANLTARVADLRRAGVGMDAEQVVKKHRDGTVVRYARYRRKEHGAETI